MLISTDYGCLMYLLLVPDKPKEDGPWLSLWIQKDSYSTFSSHLISLLIFTTTHVSLKDSCKLFWIASLKIKALILRANSSAGEPLHNRASTLFTISATWSWIQKTHKRDQRFKGFLHQKPLTQQAFSHQKLLHQEPFTPDNFYKQPSNMTNCCAWDLAQGILK